MSKPVLFLDIDGVLAVPSHVRFGRWWPEPSRVARLNAVVRRTGCIVVLSSSWRSFYGLEHTHDILREAGSAFILHSATPSCARTAGGLYIGAERGAEISEWLDDHPEHTTLAIVDDDSDMGPLADRLVLTKFDDGLQDEHVERLIALLTPPSPAPGDTWHCCGQRLTGDRCPRCGVYDD